MAKDVGSAKWARYNASKGYDGTSKWTQKDWEAYYKGESPAKKRAGSIPDLDFPDPT